MYFQSNGINELEQLTGGLWGLGMIMKFLDNHILFLKTCKVGCVFSKVNGVNELEQLTGGLGWLEKIFVVPRPSHTFF